MKAAKEYLSQILAIEKRIELKEDEIRHLRTLAKSVTAPTDREAVQKSGTSDKVGNLVVKIVDTEREITALIDCLIDKKRECVQVIDQVENSLQHSILHKRYIDNKPFPVIASELHYSYEYIRHIHSKALKSVEKILKKAQENL